MNLKGLQTVGGPTVQKAAAKVAKYAPEILTGVGIAGILGSTFLIARASTKLEPVLTKFERTLGEYKAGTADGDEKTSQKELVKIYASFSLDLIKLYGPGFTLSLTSIASILAAHGIMRKRAVTLLGAYKAVEEAFRAYRERVIEEYGIDKDRDFRLGLRTEKVTDPETGKTTKIRTLDPNANTTLYARWFDDSNENWKKEPEYNLAFIKNMENWANDKLRLRGFLFLHEVYEMLGFPTTQAAQIVGWYIETDPNKEQHGDNYVDFGIYNPGEIYNNRDFINGIAPYVFLDFNVDGEILSKI